MKALHPDTLSIEQIRVWSVDLAGLLDANDPTTSVPTCGEWTLADLVWHLTEVQLFWEHIIGHRPAGPETYDRPDRPPDPELAVGLRSSADRLTLLLEAADPADHAWSWSDDHTVGFSIRRQIHESLVHRIDGALAVGQPGPDVSSELAADGVDELIRVMISGTPSWATFEPTPGVLSIRATDTDDRWTLQPGRVIGTEPTSRKHLELDGYEVTDDAPVEAVIEAPALDLLLWMWGRRGDAAIRVEPRDQASLAARLRRTVSDATQ